MRRLMAVTALAVVVGASTVLSATAAPVTTNVVNLSVGNGSLHFDQKTVAAKPHPNRGNVILSAAEESAARALHKKRILRRASSG